MSGNNSCDWSSLPSDIIHLVSTRLSDVSDLVRLHAVCKPWHSAIPLSNPSSPCLPWLLERGPADGTDKFCYYSLSANNTYKIQLPHHVSEDTFFLYAKGVITCHNPRSRSLSLSNPLTRLVPFPLSAGVCIFYEGFYYINNYGSSETWITDATDEIVSIVPTCPEKLSCHPETHQYILESCGEILMVLRHKGTKLEDVSFSILRLDEVKGDYQWVKVIRGIGDRILFLSESTGFSLPCRDFSGFKGNCIYFLDADNLKYPTKQLCRHDLENGTTEILPNFFGREGTWFFPKFV